MHDKNNFVERSVSGYQLRNAGESSCDKRSTVSYYNYCSLTPPVGGVFSHHDQCRVRYAWAATEYNPSRRITGLFIRTGVVGRRVDR